MAYSPRTSQPSKSSKYYSSSGNPFERSGYGMWSNGGNCTAYAWGRFHEILGSTSDSPGCHLGTGNAEDWWSQTSGYKKSQTPALGAVLCLKNGPYSGYGHVAIVEKISSDGKTIWTSESGYRAYVFKYRERKAPNWNSEGYGFQGFIYNPKGGTATSSSKTLSSRVSVIYRQHCKDWISKINTREGLRMNRSGCGPCSMANVIANSINPNITPVQTWNYLYAHGYIAPKGTSWEGIRKCLSNFGVSQIQITNYPAPSAMWKEFNKGNRFAILLFKKGTQGGVKWTKGGHYVAATGYKVENGKHWFFTRDSGSHHNDGWHCYETTMSNLLKAIWICYSSTNKGAFANNTAGLNVKVKGHHDTVRVVGGVPVDDVNYSGEVVSDVLDGTDGTFVDSGQGIVLEQQIATLFSSDNYSFIKHEEVDNTPRSDTINQFKDKLTSFVSVPTELVDPSSTSQKFTIPDSDAKNYLAQAKNKYKTKLKSTGELLSYDTVIEAPTIVLNLNGVPIGGYGNIGDVYPNYITGMTVSKISGKINRYTINLVYTVRFGEDPNFIEKLISRTGFTNKIQILYGDSNGSKLFRDDEAIITDVTFNESVSSKTISYTITALSSIISAVSSTSNYGSKTAKPSTLINDLIYSTTAQGAALLAALPGMTSRTLVNSTGLIPTNDSVITTQTRLDTSPISQLSYYVSGMYNPQNNSSYYLTYMDDTNNMYGGPYLKISEIGETSTSTLAGNYFEVDVGYPGTNFVMNFTLDNDVYFPLVYKYNEKFTRWDYDIDNMGNIIKTQTNPLLSNNGLNRRNVVQSNWWKRVTEYPVTAQLTLKGLLKPILITSYIKVNVLFYGNSDLASGLYVVTGQTDSISGSGYTTTLSLLRVGS